MQSDKVIAIADFQDQFQQQDIQFLHFKTDQIINVYQKFDNGWWFGGFSHQNQELKGFFPSNFTRQINEEILQQDNLIQDMYVTKNNKLQSENKLTNQQKNGLDDNIKIDQQQQKQQQHQQNDNSNWLKYVKDQLQQGELKVKNQIYDKINVEETQIENKKFDPNFVIGYKKRKVEEKGKEGTIAIKDQSQVAKAYRQMYSYFDYEDWIEQRNLQGNKKAKADPTKKKIKKPNFKLKL